MNEFLFGVALILVGVIVGAFALIHLAYEVEDLKRRVERLESERK